jgi:Zn-dependent protease
VAGTAASLLCYFVARSEGSDLLLALAYSGFFLNLFNLIPVPPLDGGRMTGVVSPKFWLVGAPVLIGIFLWRPSPMLVIVALLAAPHVARLPRRGRAGPATTTLRRPSASNTPCSTWA